MHVQGTVKSRLPPGIDMNVNVLTSGYWPSYSHLEAKLPDELTRYQTVFKVCFPAKRRLSLHLEQILRRWHMETELHCSECAFFVKTGMADLI